MKPLYPPTFSPLYTLVWRSVRHTCRGPTYPSDVDDRVLGPITSVAREFSRNFDVRAKIVWLQMGPPFITIMNGDRKPYRYTGRTGNLYFLTPSEYRDGPFEYFAVSGECTGTWTHSRHPHDVAKSAVAVVRGVDVDGLSRQPAVA